MSRDSIATSFPPRTRSRSISTPETELADELGHPGLPILPARTGQEVGAGAYNMLRLQGQGEELGNEHAKHNQGRREGVRFGITLESGEPKQRPRQERVEVRIEEKDDEDIFWTSVR